MILKEFIMVKYIVPNWIAYQSYYINTTNSRTIISNNKNHETILLEGVSSDVYAYFTNGAENLIDFAKQKDIETTLPIFLEELRDKKLLVYDTEVDEKTRDMMVVPAYSSAGNEGEKYTQKTIETDMADWCFENGFLFSLFMEMTYKCNLRCIHCYNAKNDFRSQISINDAKRIIDEARLLGCFNLTLSGGECTLDDDFVEILEYAHQKKMNISIFTNAQSLYDNPQLLQKLIDMYPYKIGISIYSSIENKHDFVTDVKNSFNKSITVLKNLAKAGINTEFKSVQLSETVNGWKETLRLAYQNNSFPNLDITLTPTIDGDTKTRKHSISDKMIWELCVDPDSPLYLGQFDEPKMPKPNETPCFAGIRTLTITPTLDVRGCVSLPFKFGNLKTQSLLDIWKESVKEKTGKLYKWQNLKLSVFKDCFKHDYCRFCNFCPAMGILENGKYSKSEELCRIAKIKHKAFYYLKNSTIVKFPDAMEKQK